MNIHLPGQSVSSPESINGLPPRQTMKRSAERKSLILSLIESQGFVSIEELANACGVSTQTMRRDLASLSSEGRLERYHGGASPPSTVVPGTFAKRSEAHVAEKKAAAELLTEIIPNGASVFLCGGSTLTIAAEVLRARNNLIIVTNNLQAALALYDKDGFEVSVTGGRIRMASGSLVGDDTVAFVDRFYADYCVLSTAGIAPDGTMLEFDQTVVGPVSTMMRQARKRILIADSSKFNGRGVVRCGALGEMDYFLTDRQPPPNIMQIIKDNEVQLLLPSSH